MSLYSSFYASLSGLSTSASNLSVIGNNLANLNTIGFKGSSSTFQDLFAASLGSAGTQGNGNPIQIGLGTRLGGVSQNFGQGSYQSTSSVTDLAISGRGFFALETGTGTRVYTRAGNFTVDKAGFLVDPNGNSVLGWNRANGTVSITGTPSPVKIDVGSTAGAAITSTMSATTNLDASAKAGTNATATAYVPASANYVAASANYAPASANYVPASANYQPASANYQPASANYVPAGGIDPATGLVTLVQIGTAQVGTAQIGTPQIGTPQVGTAQVGTAAVPSTALTPYIPGATYTTSMQVYDSLGAAHNLIFTYTKSTPNPISGYTATGVPIPLLATPDPTGTASAWDLSVSTDGGAAVTGYPARIAFDSGGIQLGATNPTLKVGYGLSPWQNGASSQDIVWNVTSGTPAVSAITGFASDSTTSNAVQNGYGAGTIQSLMVNQDGTITGTFSNGQMVPLAQVALAVFSNQNGLFKQGDNTWAETLASGSGNVGAANQGGRGTVLGGNLELSNVDVAEEFTKLIIAQRGYQANSRVVTTSDELLQETLNLKR